MEIRKRAGSLGAGATVARPSLLRVPGHSTLPCTHVYKAVMPLLVHCLQEALEFMGRPGMWSLKG